DSCGDSLRFECEASRVTPKPLKLVERALCRMKDVHDNVEKIQEHPPSLLQSFHVHDRIPRGLHAFEHVLRDAAYMCVGRAAGDHEIVRHVRNAVQVQHDQVSCLEVKAKCGSPTSQ